MTPDPQPRPVTVVIAAAAQALEGGAAIGAVFFTLKAAFAGEMDSTGTGLALALFGLVIGAGLLAVVWGLWGLRRWSRAPAILTQLLILVVGASLIQTGQYGWGVPAVALAVIAVAGLLAPATTKALDRADASPPS